MEHFYQNISGWFNFQNLYSSVVYKFPTNSRFAEIGVWQGASLSYLAVEILNSKKSIKIDAIDTWLGSPEHTDKNSPHYDSRLEETDWLYNTFLKNIEPVKEIVNVVRKPSVEASLLYEDNTFDFVFIDANHEMPFVYDDICAWYPKVKNGGILAGHDVQHPPVLKAITEFCNTLQIKFDTINGSSWILTK